MISMASFRKANSKREVTEDNVLNQRTRREIYELIRNNEGLHFRSICRNLGRKMGVVQYHVSVLEKHGLIRSVRDGRYKCFFADNSESISNGDSENIGKERKRLRETVITSLRR